MRSPLASLHSCAAAASSRAWRSRPAARRVRADSSSAALRCAVHSARLGVENDHGAVLQRLQLRPQAHHHGHTQRGGEDGHVRGRASGHERNAAQSSVVDVDELRGREIARDENSRPRECLPAVVCRRRARAAPGARDRPGPRHARRGARRRWPPAPRHWCAGCRAMRIQRSCRRGWHVRARDASNCGSSSSSRWACHDVAHGRLRALRALLDAARARRPASAPARRLPCRHPHRVFVDGQLFDFEAVHRPDDEAAAGDHSTRLRARGPSPLAAQVRRRAPARDPGVG